MEQIGAIYDDLHTEIANNVPVFGVRGRQVYYTCLAPHFLGSRRSLTIVVFGN